MYKEIAANKRKTVFIMIVFIAFVAVMAWLVTKFLNGSNSIFIGAFIGSLIYVVISYFAGTRISLSATGAKEVQKRDNPRLYRIVENLSITDGLPTPKVYVINDPAPNAFATGRKPSQSSVAVTTGLLDIMNDQELEGVLAHEMGHIKNYDIRVAMVAFALVMVIGLLADIMLRLSFFSGDDDDNTLFFILGIVAALLAPLVASLIQLAISRKREYLADATGALTTRYPEGLASALGKIEKHGSVMKKQSTSTAHFFFANPLKKRSLSSLFSTHPPIEDRIARLKQMESNA